MSDRRGAATDATEEIDGTGEIDGVEEVEEGSDGTTARSPDLAERYLTLLAADRPVEDYEELLHTSTTEGTDPAEVARLHELALRARGLRELDHRRESELTALFETVADLAALKDVDDVLEAIVRRVRTLLGCDVSYLSLNDDEAGMTRMRVTQGIHTEEFRNVRLGFGEGLGGLVAQTARPYATADYFNDDRFQHTRPIDSAVGGEELTAILGVPLLLGRTVIGVLYAANHDPRPFGRDDVDLLTSFAAHAAVALDNARRIEDTQAALADLRETSELLRRNVEAVQRAAQAHDRLAAVVLQGGSLGDVAVELHEVLQTEVVVVDSHGVVLAASEEGATLDPAHVELVEAALADDHTHVADGASVAPVWAGGAPLAAVLLPREVDDAERRILERAATTAALIMVVQQSVAETESRMRGDLLVDLLVGRTGSGSLTARASLLGADLSRPLGVLVVDGADPGTTQLAGDLAARHGGLVAEVGERLVLVVADRDPLTEARALVDRVRATNRSTVGRVLPTVGAAVRCTVSRGSGRGMRRRPAAWRLSSPWVDGVTPRTRPRSASSGCCWAAATPASTSAPGWRPCSTTTGSAARRWSPPWRPGSPRTGTWAAPASACTCTPTP